MHEVKVALFDEFLDAYSEVPKSKQKKVRQFVQKFRRNPRASGINYEKIEAARDPKMRSVRIDQEYRGIVLKPESGNVYVLMWVDHHDDAYQWARNKLVQIHPETGSLQMIPIEEGTAVLPGDGQEEESTDEEPDDLYAEYRDRELVRLGVPEELIPLVRPVVVGWMNMIDALNFMDYRFEFRDDARRFEPGSYNIAGILSMGASIDMLREVGVEQVSEEVRV
jgi:hypothetical protein